MLTRRSMLKTAAMALLAPLRLVKPELPADSGNDRFSLVFWIHSDEFPQVRDRLFRTLGCVNSKWFQGHPSDTVLFVFACWKTTLQIMPELTQVDDEAEQARLQIEEVWYRLECRFAYSSEGWNSKWQAYPVYGKANLNKIPLLDRPPPERYNVSR